MADISKEELLKQWVIELLVMKAHLSEMSNIDFKEGENGV